MNPATGGKLPVVRDQVRIPGKESLGDQFSSGRLTLIQGEF